MGRNHGAAFTDEEGRLELIDEECDGGDENEGAIHSFILLLVVVVDDDDLLRARCWIR
jgi:hypothetical protein